MGSVKPEKIKNSTYDKIETEDGSITLYSHLYNEACHSTSGAINETHTHYINGCKIPELIHQDSTPIILEIGFGTGIGFIETQKIFEQTKTYFEFISFEIDPKLIELFSEQYGHEFQIDHEIATCQTENYKLTVHLGDARLNINKVTQKVDAIYQDAFSPKKNADLWTTEWFQDLFKLAKKHTILSTYSSSSSIRKSLIAAGWILYKGEKFGPKRSSTRAKITGTTDEEITAQLSRSPAPEITDQNYQDYQEGKLI